MAELEAFCRFCRNVLATEDNRPLEIENFQRKILEAGADQVVVVADERGHGKGSGASFERHSGTIFTLRGGSVVKLKFFQTGEDALEAAGLRE
jgi:hypothetical protein